MSIYTKTLIVDPDGLGDYSSINAAAYALRQTGGTIIVESGTYIIDGSTNDGDKRTVGLYSNTAIIGRGNVVINLINNNDVDISAFRNAGPYIEPAVGNENIAISGFKIVVSPTVEYGPGGNAGVIKLVNVKNCRIEKVYITCDQDSDYGVFPGDPATSNDLYPAAAIRIESNFEGHTVKENCTGNIITQCVIHDFGKTLTGNEDESANNHFGIGILVKGGNRNRVIYNHICRVKICCIVEQGDNNIIKNNIFRDPMIFTYAYENPKLNTLCLLVRQDSPGSYPVNNPIVSGNLFLGKYPRQEYVKLSYMDQGQEIVYYPGTECRSIGIYFSGPRGGIYRGNVVFRISGGGLRVAYPDTYHNALTGNVFYEIGGGGLQLSDATSRNNAFGNCSVRNYFAGIMINYTDYGYADYNNVVGNLCHDNLHGQEYAGDSKTEYYQVRAIGCYQNNLLADNHESWLEDKVNRPAFNIPDSVIPDSVVWTKGDGWLVGYYDPNVPHEAADTMNPHSCVTKHESNGNVSIYQSPLNNLINDVWYRVRYEVLQADIDANIQLSGPFDTASGSITLDKELGMHEIFLQCKHYDYYFAIVCTTTGKVILDNISVTPKMD